MKRWDHTHIKSIGEKLFAKIHKRKKQVHDNHEIYTMAREIDEWLPEGIQTLIDGSYDPRLLKLLWSSKSVHLAKQLFRNLVASYNLKLNEAV